MSILMTILPSLSLLNKINQFIKTRGGENFSLNYGLFLLSWKSGLRVSEAISFDYQLKHPRHKGLYSVKGKGNKTRYVYISPAVISELKTNHWRTNKTNRFVFNNFLKKVKEKMNISANVELSPHTLRRCFTTHNALNGVPMPILQKVLGHANIRTTSGYWKGSVDIREFGGWLEPDSIPKEPEEIPKVKVGDSLQLPKTPTIPTKLENSSPNKEPKLLKTIEKLKGDLKQKDLIIAEKNKQLKSKDSEIYLLTIENQKLKVAKQEGDQQLAKYRQKLKKIIKENKSPIENYARLKNATKNKGKIKEKQELEVSLVKNKSLAKEQEQAELVTEIQVWKPPN